MLKTVKKKPKQDSQGDDIATEIPTDNDGYDTDQVDPNDDTDTDVGDESEDELEDVEIETEALLELNREIEEKEIFLGVVSEEGASPSTVQMAFHLGLMTGTAVETGSVESFRSEDEIRAGVEAVQESLKIAQEGFLDGLKNLAVAACQKVLGLFKGIMSGAAKAAAGGWKMTKEHPIATLMGLVTCMAGGVAIARFAAGTAIGQLTTEQAAMGFFGRICAMFKNIRFPDGTKIVADLAKFGKRIKIQFIKDRAEGGILHAAKGAAVNAGKAARGAGIASVKTSASPMQVVNSFKSVLKGAWAFVTDLPKFIATRMGPDAVKALNQHQHAVGKKIYRMGGKKVMGVGTSTSIVRFVEANVAFVLFTSLVKIVWRCAKKFLSFFTGGSSAPAPAPAPGA